MSYIVIRKKDRRGHGDKNKRRPEMDIIITMAYTALMTFVMTKVVEHTPKDHKR